MHIRKDRERVLEVGVCVSIHMQYVSSYNEKQIPIAVGNAIAPSSVDPLFVGVMDWDHEQTSTQRGYSSMELPNRNARQDTFVMWVLDSGINLSCLSSSSMRDFLKVIAPNLSSVTPKKFLYEWLPETQERVST